MQKSVLVPILICCFALAGCRDEGLPVDPPVSPEPPAPNYTVEEEQVIANCYILQQAVEAFAADNNGIYPHSESDENLSGNTFVDLLPGGRYMENPYSGRNTEPRWGVAAYPGECGYVKVSDATGTPVDYTISGFGESEIILYLSKDSPLP